MSKDKEQDREVSLEAMFSQIKDIIEELENPDIPIEEAFARYEGGMKLLKSANDKLDTIEKKVMEISKDGELNEFQ